MVVAGALKTAALLPCSLIPAGERESCVALHGSASCRLAALPLRVGAMTACKVQESGRGVFLPPYTILRRASVSKTSRSAPARFRVGVARAENLVQKVTARELDDILSQERTQPMVLDFYATWCGPCILLAQELEKLAVEYGQTVRFLKVDTDEEYELAAQMQIRGLPTMVFVSTDTQKLAIRTEGLLPSQTIRDIIENEL